MKTLEFTAAAVLAMTLAAPAAHAKNYLIVIADDLSVDKVDSYSGDYPGYAAAATYLPDTQTIDSLADAGLRFTRAWATPLCSPTRASFQTGQYPFRTGVGTALGSNADGLDPTAFTMLGQSFSTFGYKTGFFGKWHIGTEDAAGNFGVPPTPTFTDEPHPSLSGWDRFFGNYDGYPGDYFSWQRVGWLSGGNGFTAIETAHATDRTAEVALNWINSRTTDWIAVVAFNAPHSGSTASSVWDYSDVDPTRFRTPALACLATQTCADEPLSVYQGLVEHMDLELEELLNGIDPCELDETIIIFFGDNGTPSAVQQGDFDVAGRGKGNTYENGVRVPLIVADGGTWRTGAAGDITSPGREVDLGVNVLDVYQTLHEDAFNIAVLDVDSRSFADCFSNTDPFCGFAKRYGYTETFTTSGLGISSAKIGVRYGHDKMVATYDTVNDCLDETFYETDTDPFETTPITTWTATREDRLRDHFTNLHTPVATSWAYANGPLVGFCP